MSEDQTEERDSKRTMWKNVKPAHEKLWIWQKARELHLRIWEICKTLPHHEKYRLVQQIERASRSVRDNIAEGNESYYYNDKTKGFMIARKEAGETQNQIREMEDKDYTSPKESQDMIDEYEEIKRGINGMVRMISEKRDMSGRKGSKRM